MCLNVAQTLSDCGVFLLGTLILCCFKTNMGVTKQEARAHKPSRRTATDCLGDSSQAVPLAKVRQRSGYFHLRVVKVVKKYVKDL